MAQGNTGCAAWMREQADNVITYIEWVKVPEFSCMVGPEYAYQQGFNDALEIGSRAIRAIHLPTDSDLLAEAMTLPEVAALMEALSDAIDANPTELNLGNYDHDDVCRLQSEAIDVRLILSAALAPFTAAKETA